MATAKPYFYRPAQLYAARQKSERSLDRLVPSAMRSEALGSRGKTLVAGRRQGGK
jgi:hypothetical protein